MLAQHLSKKTGNRFLKVKIVNTNKSVTIMHPPMLTKMLYRYWRVCVISLINKLMSKMCHIYLKSTDIHTSVTEFSLQGLPLSLILLHFHQDHVLFHTNTSAAFFIHIQHILNTMIPRQTRTPKLHVYHIGA